MTAAEQPQIEAIGLLDFGGPEVLRSVKLPLPEPGPGEVRIATRAVGVNPTDATFRAGARAAQLADRPSPYVPGMDIAGVVDMLGPDPDGRLAVGDRVVAYVIPFGPRGGTYAEKVVADHRSVVAMPRQAGFAEASTLLLNAVTAAMALDAIGAKEGDAVGVTGAAGAVGGFAVELGAARGLRMLAEVGPADRVLADRLGATAVVGRGVGTTEEFRALVPDGLVGIVDAADRSAGVLAAIADDGALASVKGWAGPAERGIRVAPISSFDAAFDTALFERLVAAAEAGTLTLRVADVLPASAASEAHRRLATGGLRGRLVLDFSR
jgi:NADPH2:quinone reductase